MLFKTLRYACRVTSSETPYQLKKSLISESIFGEYRKLAGYVVCDRSIGEMIKDCKAIDATPYLGVVSMENESTILVHMDVFLLVSIHIPGNVITAANNSTPFHCSLCSLCKHRAEQTGTYN